MGFLKDSVYDKFMSNKGKIEGAVPRSFMFDVISISFFFSFRNLMTNIFLVIGVDLLLLMLFLVGFKKLAESNTTLLSRIRLNTDHDESDTKYKFIPRLGLESIRLG